MTTDALRTRRWATSALHDPAGTSAADLAMLGEHLTRCQYRRGAWLALHDAGAALSSFTATRLVTTWVLFFLVSVGAALLG